MIKTNAKCKKCNQEMQHFPSTYVGLCSICDTNYITNKCEVLNGKKVCGKEATFKVRHREQSEDKEFGVCKKHIPAYDYVQGKEWGNRESVFIINNINKQK